MEWLKTLAGIRLTHVPCNGTGPALNDPDAATRIAQERERWRKIIAAAGIKAQ